MSVTGHVDTFARDRLPPRTSWPELVFPLPELHYSGRLNCAVRLLDRHIEQGLGPRRCIVTAQETWSYGDLFRAANRIARILVEDMGVVPGNRVLLRGFNGSMLAASWLAVMKSGAIAVTTMPLYRAGELAYIVEKAQVRHALCDRRLEADLREATPGDGFRTLCWEDGGGDLETRMRAKPETFANCDTGAEDVAIIAFTSGTTGKPKAAMHFHRDLAATCDTFGKHVLRALAEDVFCGSPPLAFTFGLGGLLLFPLDVGAATILLEKANAETLLDAVERFRASVMFTAPVAYRAMTPLLSNRDVASLRACVSAGETLPATVWEGWKAATGLRIIDGIGSTEMLHIFVASPQEESKAGSTGKAVPGYEAQIHGDDGRPVPLNTVGRLAVKGPTGCKYLEDVRQGVYAQNGWNYPGDAYRMDDDGYFWYLARTDDMIIAAGYNVSGPEVEEALLAHPAVAECAVVAKPDRSRGTNIVKAYVALAQPQAATAQELQTFVHARIAPYKAPREIEFVDALPRTESGKIQRFRLRERAAAE